MLHARLTTTQRLEAWLSGAALGLIVILGATSLLFFKYYQQRYYPGTVVDGVEIGGLTRDQAKQRLLDQFRAPPEYQVTLRVDDISVSSGSAQLGLQSDLEMVLSQAFNVNRDTEVSRLVRLPRLIKAWWQPVKLESGFSYDPAAVGRLVGALVDRANIPSEQPSADLNLPNAPAGLVINPGQVGRQVQATAAAQLVMASANRHATELTAPVASTGARLNQDQQTAARQRALRLVGVSINLTGPDIALKATDQELLKLLKFPIGYDRTAAQTYIEQVAARVNRPPTDAEFVYNQDTLKVEQFKPHRDGLELQQPAMVNNLLAVLALIEQAAQAESNPTQAVNYDDTFELELVVSVTVPDRQLADTNELGIVELIGFGDSFYKGSIPNRLHNVALTSQIINNTIVPPGEEFSFNRTLGEVSARTGFRSAYIIKGGQTVLGDGGGVCQISTTMFRSVLDAGLKITKRRQHSYRVSYYEQNAKPGLDATVYAGDIDLRFINDTDHHILIHSQADNDTAYAKVEIYGSSDGRTTELVEHTVFDHRPPAPTEYYDDPNLPPGTLKQIDFAVGGVKTEVVNVVRDKDGHVISEDSYASNYRPWAAKFLRGI